MQPNPTSPARTRSFVLAVCLVFPFALQLYAASPPSNDTCEDAEVSPPTAGLSSPYFTAIVSDFRSATTNGEPPLTNSCGIDIRETIWYSFQPTSDGLYTFSTAFDTATTLADPVIGIYTAGGGCSSTTPLPQIDCNDDSGGSHNRAAISTTLSAGTQYYIVIWSAVVLDLNDVPENYSVQIRVSRPATSIRFLENTCQHYQHQIGGLILQFEKSGNSYDRSTTRHGRALPDAPARDSFHTAEILVSAFRSGARLFL
jgi:hypothetical protein